jgi:hypothetical protein
MQWPSASDPGLWAGLIVFLVALVGYLDARRRLRGLTDIVYLLATRGRSGRPRSESRRRACGEEVR